MSNEEIVVRIQAGEENLYSVLWEQVERLVAWKARRVANAIDGNCGVVFDDLYNSGFLAMVAAVDSYKAENGSFSTWLMYYLKTAFSEVTGIRTKTVKNDPLRGVLSFSAPIGDDDSDGTFFDITPDPESQVAFESVEAQLLFSQVREALAAALAAIPTEQSIILQQRYFEQKTLAEVGQAMGMTAGKVRGLEWKGLQAMRQPKIAEKLRPIYEDFDFYSCNGLGYFRSAGMSVQERYLICMEHRDKK